MKEALSLFRSQTTDDRIFTTCIWKIGFWYQKNIPPNSPPPFFGPFYKSHQFSLFFHWETELITLIFCRVAPGASYMEQPKFIVFFCSLMTIFSMFCFTRKARNPKVSMERNGTMVRVAQHCDIKCQKKFDWQSQPFVLGRYPAGNILLSFATYIKGALSRRFCSI